MPLITFSRFLAPKSPASNAQYQPSGSPVESAQFLTAPPSNTASQSPISPRSFTTPWGSAKRKKEAVEPRSPSSKARESRAFAFTLDPFNVLASFRSRSKVKVTDSVSGCDTGSVPVSSHSQSSYSGYEDEDYGEPEAESEEIRRPSGLGRRASVVDSVTPDDVVDAQGVMDTVEDGKDAERDEGAVQPDTENTHSRPSTDSADSEELGNIRCPSGLGNIKLVVNTLDTERPMSTYPFFEFADKDEESHSEDALVAIAWYTASTPTAKTLSRFSVVVPLLAPYLCLQTLLSLSLVNHAVAEESRRLLWKDISLGLMLRPDEGNDMTVDGDRSASIFDILSTRHELASHVRSLELSCRLESVATNSTPISPRSRPAPLRISPPTSYFPKSAATLLVPSSPMQPLTAPLPTKADPDASPSENADTPRSASKLRRASSLLRPSLLLNASVPNTWRPSSVRLRPPSMQLPRSLSILRTRSSELMGRSASENSSRSQSPSSDEPETSASPFNVLSLPGESRWTPPGAWDRVVTDARPFSPAHRASYSLSHPPSSGWNAPAEWGAKPSGALPEIHIPRLQPSLPTLRTRPPPSPTSPSSDKTPTLRASPSLPTLRVLHSPSTPRPGVNYNQDVEPPSPVTTAPSPITPYSSVSLSAFPLPPQASTLPSVPPLPMQFSHSYIEDAGDSTPTALTPSTPTPLQYRKTDTRPLKILSTALDKMVNLAHVTLVFTYPPTSSDALASEILPSFKGHSSSDNRDSRRVADVSATLRDVIIDVKSLKSLKVVYPAGHEEAYRGQWMELVDFSKGLQVEITSVR